jgi:hypothetical protein
MLWLLIRPAVNWFDNNLRFRYSRWVQRSATPSDIQRHTRKIDNTSVPTVATQIMRGAHKDTVHRARFDAQSAKHALGIINGETGDLETLTVRDPFLPDINAIHRTGFSTLITCNARRQIVPVKTPIARRHGDWPFWVFKPMCKRPAPRFIGFKPVPQRYPQSVSHGRHGVPNIAQPPSHRIHHGYFEKAE